MRTTLRHYTRGFDLISMQTGTDADRVYHFDHQGTAKVLTDGVTGTVTDRFDSDAWGVNVQHSGQSINKHWYVGNSGYYTDQPAPDYVRARFYTPRLGLWNSRETIPIIAASEGIYRYVANSPGSDIDPTGHVKCTKWAAQTHSTTCQLWRVTKPAPTRPIKKWNIPDQWIRDDGCISSMGTPYEGCTEECHFIATGSWSSKLTPGATPNPVFLGHLNTTGGCQSPGVNVLSNLAESKIGDVFGNVLNFIAQSTGGGLIVQPPGILKPAGLYIDCSGGYRFDYVIMNCKGVRECCYRCKPKSVSFVITIECGDKPPPWNCVKISEGWGPGGGSFGE